MTSSDFYQPLAHDYSYSTAPPPNPTFYSLAPHPSLAEPLAPIPSHPPHSHQQAPTTYSVVPHQHYRSDSLSYQDTLVAEERARQEALLSGLATATVDDLYDPDAPYLVGPGESRHIHYHPPTYPVFSPPPTTSSIPGPTTSQVPAAFNPPNAPQAPPFIHYEPTEQSFDPWPGKPEVSADDTPSAVLAPYFLSAIESTSSSTSSHSNPSLPASAAPPSRSSTSTSHLPRPTSPNLLPTPRAIHPGCNRAHTAPRSMSDALVALAAAQRADVANFAPLVAGPPRKDISVEKASGGSGASTPSRTKKNLLEVQSSCWTCGDSIARLVLRGADLEQVISTKGSGSCLSCLPAVEARVEEETEQAREPIDGATYEDTISAAVDRLQGLKLAEEAQEAPAPQTAAAKLPDELKEDAFTCEQ